MGDIAREIGEVFSKRVNAFRVCYILRDVYDFMDYCIKELRAGARFTYPENGSPQHRITEAEPLIKDSGADFLLYIP